jgi:NADH:ubiquinone oxidoreductase subunit
MYIGTILLTWIDGKLVGADEFANRYYRSRSGRKRHGRECRWVMFKGRPEATKVPPEWHAWLHHTTSSPLTEDAARTQDWQKECLPNMTGTEGAYLPRGHDLKGSRRSKATGDYQAWTPE